MSVEKNDVFVPSSSGSWKQR